MLIRTNFWGAVMPVDNALQNLIVAIQQPRKHPKAFFAVLLCMARK